MWQSIVSLDSKYNLEAQQLQESLEESEKIYFAKNSTPSRIFFSVAGREEDFSSMQGQLYCIIADIIAVNMKFHYFEDLIKDYPLSEGLVCVISALVGYEQDNEFEYVNQMLDKLYEYSIDGIINFRLKSLIEGWREVGEMLVAMMKTNPSQKELYAVAAYLMSERKKNNKVFVADSNQGILTVVNSKKVLKTRKLFDNKNYDLLQTLINFNPVEVIIDDKNSSKEFVECVRNIFPLKML